MSHWGAGLSLIKTIGLPAPRSSLRERFIPAAQLAMLTVSARKSGRAPWKYRLENSATTIMFGRSRTIASIALARQTAHSSETRCKRVSYTGTLATAQPDFRYVTRRHCAALEIESSGVDH